VNTQREGGDREKGEYAGGGGRGGKSADDEYNSAAKNAVNKIREIICCSGGWEEDGRWATNALDG
jgi:hypothetical protein